MGRIGPSGTAASSAWLKRQAVQIIGMLPEDPAQARAVLAYSLDVLDYLDRESPNTGVVRLVRPVAETG